MLCHGRVSCLWACVFFDASLVAVGAELCSADGQGRGLQGCGVRHIVDYQNKELVSKLFENGMVDEPVLIRGATKHWKASKTAEKGWKPLQKELIKRWGREALGFKTSAHVAQFGGSMAAFDKNKSLDEYLHNIEIGGLEYTAFQSRSSIGAKMVKKGYYALDMEERGYFKSFEEQPVISFGGDGDGLPFHTHGQTILGMVLGVKQWLLMAPGHMTEEVLGDSFNVTRYMDRLMAKEGGRANWPKGMMYCQQQAGDALYVPFNWWHATRNDGISIGLGGQQDSMDDIFAMVNTNDLDEIPGFVYPVPDQEIRARKKLMSNDPSINSEGLADMFDLYQRLPSKLSITFHIVAFLVQKGQAVMASAQMQRMKRHLLGLEVRRGIDGHNLAALFAHFGEQVVNRIGDTKLALDFLEESLRLDDKNPAAWHNSAYAYELAQRDGNQKEGPERRKQIKRRLRIALKLQPTYKPSLDAMKQLGLS